MSQRRFFIEPAAVTGETAVLQGPEAHHLSRVLRLAPGEEITLFDGTGARYLARLEQVAANRATATVLARSRDQEPPVRVHLGQALLKGEKMDFVLQKATELGIASIHLFASEHGTGRPPDAAKLERWQRIVLEACKQCDRARPPELHAAGSLARLLAEPPECGLKIIFWEQEGEESLATLLAPGGQRIESALFLVGPEGGFSRAEVAAARERGFLPASLGPRLLRAETASLAGAAILQFALGNLVPRASS